MEPEFLNPVRNEEVDDGAADQRREPMPEQGDGDPLREQLQLNATEMEEEDHGRELVGENSELQTGACESTAHPEEPDGAVEFVMIGSCVERRGEVSNNGTQLRWMASAQWSNWPKLKTVLEEK